MAWGELDFKGARGELMEKVSARFTPYADRVSADVQVEFELIDIDAAEVAEVSASAACLISQLEQVHDSITLNSAKLATLEWDYWGLDGTFALPKAQDNGEVGYWSAALSDSEGNIDVEVVAQFDTPQSSDGFTICFDAKTESVASDFVITTYNGDSLINSVAVVGNKEVVRIVECPSLNYDKVVVNFSKTDKGYRRVKVCEIVFGYLQRFNKDKLVSLRLIDEISLDMQSLPAKKLEFTLDNADQSYNVLNPEGIYAFLQQGQGINVSMSINGEAVGRGRFYFDSAVANDDALTATVCGYDLLYRLDQGTFGADSSGAWTFGEAVRAVVADSGVDLAVDIAEDIAARLVGKCVPADTSHREALRLLAQAAKTCLYINRLDVLMAQDFAIATAVDELSVQNMTTWGKASDTGRINTVVVTASDEFSGVENVYTATNQTLGEPKQVLEIDNPLVLDETVAAWILDKARLRNKYTTTAMGNPARDTGDSVWIGNVYGTKEKAVVIEQTTTFDGSLLDNITAVGKGGGES